MKHVIRVFHRLSAEGLTMTGSVSAQILRIQVAHRADLERLSDRTLQLHMFITVLDLRLGLLSVLAIAQMLRVLPTSVLATIRALL